MDWNRYRAEMPITQRWAFFDHAAVAPITARAQKAISEWAADMAENGDVMEHRWVQRIEEVRGLAGEDKVGRVPVARFRIRRSPHVNGAYGSVSCYFA